jgi:hypothetical protein
MRAELRLDTARFRRALAEFARNSRKSGIEVVTVQAKLWVRDMVRITPPAQGSLGGAKGRGEKAAGGDVYKVVAETRRPAAKTAEEIHRQFRSRRTGRVWKDLRTGKDRRYRAQGVRAYVQRNVKQRVGRLAAGWNAAAARLGLSLPSWITRHGASGGRIEVKVSLGGIRIRVANAVSFIGQVKGLDRRARSAFDNRARAMEKQLEAYALKKAARDAGLKVRG